MRIDAPPSATNTAIVTNFPRTFTNGTKIVTHGLTKRPELNGMTGTIDKWSCKLGQYLVDMDENGSKVALKAECLSILVREEDDYSKEPAMEERTKKKRNSERAKHYEQGVE